MLTEATHSKPIVAPLRRLRQLIIRADLLVASFVEMGRPGKVIRASGMPEDARVVGVMLSDRFPNEFRIIIESETFEPIREGYEMPWLELTLSAEWPNG